MPPAGGLWGGEGGSARPGVSPGAAGAARVRPEGKVHPQCEGREGLTAVLGGLPAVLRGSLLSWGGSLLSWGTPCCPGGKVSKPAVGMLGPFPAGFQTKSTGNQAGMGSSLAPHRPPGP